MNKIAYSGRMALLAVLLIILGISAGCIGVENRDNTTGPSPEDSIPVHLTGIIQTPVTPDMTPTGDNYPGVSPLTTPNESNSGPDFLHPSRNWDIFPVEEVSRPLYIPMHLPGGFSYEGGSYATNGIVWLRISNSTTNVTYIQAPDSRDPGVFPGGDGVRVQQIYAHDRNYTYKESGTQHQLSWSREDLHFSLTGEPGPDELLLIAGSVAPVSAESLRQLLMER
jgi:hypothetical protein